MGFLSKTTHSLLNFYRKDLWEPAGKRSQNFLRSLLRHLLLATKVFLREQMQFRASALTYSFLLAIVPILAIVFAIAKGFGLGEFLTDEIRQAFATQPEVAETLLGFVEQYLMRTQGGVFLGFGILLLLWTLFSLCGNVEASFNQIWQLRSSRRLSRQITDYTSVFFLLPIFIVVSSGLSIFLSNFVQNLPNIFFLHSSLLSLLRLLPFVLMAGFCTLLYAFMPNTHVHIRSALVAGIPVGIIVQLLQYLYINSQVYLTSYNAVYGSFAALPLLMLWIQFVWYALLFGCALSYVDQNLSHFYYGEDKLNLSRAEFDRLTLRLLRAVCIRTQQGEEPYTFGELAAHIRTPEPVVSDILQTLTTAGIIEAAVPNKDDKEQTRYYLRQDINQLTVGAVLAQIDNQPATHSAPLSPIEPNNPYTQFRQNFYQGDYAQQPLHKLDNI